MRRIRLRTGAAALFGAFFLAALIVFLPLRLALALVPLDDTGFAARAATGSVWAGHLSEASFGGVALGDLDARLSPLQLLVGRARLDLRGGDGAAAPLSGALGVSRHTVGVDDLTATLPAGRLFEPVPVGALGFDDVSVRFRDDACEHAEGRVRATLAGDIAGIGAGEAISGAVRCDGGALLLPLASASGTENVELRLWRDGRFNAALTVAASDPTAAAQLEQAGFIRRGAGYVLAAEGRF